MENQQSNSSLHVQLTGKPAVELITPCAPHWKTGLQTHHSKYSSLENWLSNSLLHVHLSEKLAVKLITPQTSYWKTSCWTHHSMYTSLEKQLSNSSLHVHLTRKPAVEPITSCTPHWKTGHWTHHFRYNSMENGLSNLSLHFTLLGNRPSNSSFHVHLTGKLAVTLITPYTPHWKSGCWTHHSRYTSLEKPAVKLPKDKNVGGDKNSHGRLKPTSVVKRPMNEDTKSPPTRMRLHQQQNSTWSQFKLKSRWYFYCIRLALSAILLQQSLRCLTAD